MHYRLSFFTHKLYYCKKVTSITFTLLVLLRAHFISKQKQCLYRLRLWRYNLDTLINFNLGFTKKHICQHTNIMLIPQISTSYFANQEPASITRTQCGLHDHLSRTNRLHAMSTKLLGSFSPWLV